MHQLLDHRAQGADPARIASCHGRLGFWMRHLPGGFCPVNRKARATSDPNFGRRDLTALDLIELLDMTEEEFRQRFAGTPLMRAKWVGMQRNACVALGNLHDPFAVPALARALEGANPLVKRHAAWALGGIGGADARTALDSASLSEQDPDVRAEVRMALDAIDAA